MKNKILLASLSVTFVVAMQLTKQDRNNAEQISQKYAIQPDHSPAGGGVTTDDPMPQYSLLRKTAGFNYSYQTTDTQSSSLVKLPASIQFDREFCSNNPTTLSENQARFTLPLNLLPTDPYNACDITPANCTNNMADYKIPIDSIRKSDTLSYAKTGVSPIPNYHDVKYKDDILDPNGDDFTISEDELKGCAAQRNFCETDSSALHYIVYSPMNVDYTSCKLPGIILFHAGGYSDCSNYKYEDTLCLNLARKGFIVYLVEYRRGRIKYAGTVYTTAQQMLAIYRAMQDGRGAIRSIIKRQRNIAYNHLPYQVDTNNIFVAGQSAGAVIANSLAYYKTQAMINAVFPVPAGEPSIESALGPIDADYYYGTMDIEYQSKIKGLWSMWGGFPIPMVNGNPMDIYDFLTNNGANTNLVPMIGFMGKKDPVFHFDSIKQFVYYPRKNKHEDSIYTIEKYCLVGDSLKVYGGSGKIVLRMACTNDIWAMLKAHNKASLEYIDCLMGHSLAPVKGWQICSTDFGDLTDRTLNQVNEYMAARAGFFFQSILYGTANSLDGATRFKDCFDNRYSSSMVCATAENNAGCGDNDSCN